MFLMLIRSVLLLQSSLMLLFGCVFFLNTRIRQIIKISSFEFPTLTKLNPTPPHQTQSNVDTSIRLRHSLEDSLISHSTYPNHTQDDPDVLRTLILLSRHIVDDILFGAVE